MGTEPHHNTLRGAALAHTGHEPSGFWFLPKGRPSKKLRSQTLLFASPDLAGQAGVRFQKTKPNPMPHLEHQEPNFLCPAAAPRHHLRLASVPCG